MVNIGVMALVNTKLATARLSAWHLYVGRAELNFVAGSESCLRYAGRRGCCLE